MGAACHLDTTPICASCHICGSRCATCTGGRPQLLFKATCACALNTSAVVPANALSASALWAAKCWHVCSLAQKRQVWGHPAHVLICALATAPGPDDIKLAPSGGGEGGGFSTVHLALMHRRR